MEEDQILEARLKAKDTQQTAKCNLIRVHDCAAELRQKFCYPGGG